MNLIAKCRCRITLIVAAVVVAIHVIGSLTPWLQTDYPAIADGQWWRIWTGHLTHYDTSHLFWDLLMFVVLSAACERKRPRFFLPVLASMAAVITFAIGIACPEITIYRGLSGIDTGLFVWFATMQIHQCRVDQDAPGVLLWTVPCAGLIGKLIFEAVTGQTLFVDSSGFTPLVESHLAGAAFGLALFGWELMTNTPHATGQEPHDLFFTGRNGLTQARNELT